MRALARIAYGFILQLHPHGFRTEFGDEMLWIFDEQMHCGESGVARIVVCTQLLLDAFSSAFIQRALREEQQQTVGPQFDQMSPSACLIRVAQTGFIAFSCLLSVFTILSFLHMAISGL